MNPKTRHVLFLGSGLMAQTVIKALTSRPENRIHIASNIIDDAKKLANKYPNCTFGEVDVMKKESLGPLIEKAELVISFVPAFLHIHIAKLCLEYGRNMVTASYVSPEMRALHDQAKNKGLIFLNELGLDPGIDHMSTMKVIDEIKKEGGKIVEYESWCGGLPSPQFCDNPLGYKFTWSPIGAMRATKNSARYILDKKQYVVPEKDLLYSISSVEINPALSLEGYPNRDSIAYQAVYNLEGADKIMRGTLRYKGFCTIIAALKELGLLSEQPVTQATWVEYLRDLLKDEKPYSGVLDESVLESKAEEELISKIAHRTVETVKHYQSLTDQQKKQKLKKIITGMRFFGLLNPSTQINDAKANNLENLVNLLEKKLKLKPNETDLIAMQHIFKVQLPGRKPFIRKSSLVLIGDKRGFSGMSETVGLPAALGAQMVLDNLVKARGVLIPTIPELYTPILKGLEEHGIKLVEEDF